MIGSNTEAAVIDQNLMPISKPIKSDNQSMVDALIKYFYYN